jgi:hypothetical protein
MTYTVHQSQIRTIRQEDPSFLITDKFIMTPRAGFEINEKCPREYRQIIAACIDQVA